MQLLPKLTVGFEHHSTSHDGHKQLIIFTTIFWSFHSIVNHTFLGFGKHRSILAKHCITFAKYCPTLGKHSLNPANNWAILAKNSIILAKNWATFAKNWATPAKNSIILAKNWAILAKNWAISAKNTPLIGNINYLKHSLSILFIHPLLLHNPKTGLEAVAQNKSLCLN
jgi:hypothetical protein